MLSEARHLSPRVSAAADVFLRALDVDAIDPEGTISLSSRRLCAGLGVLSQATYAALGGTAAADEIGLAGAMLSLLTKLDDQVIDAPAFHRGLSRAEAKERTRAYLAPTLEAIRTGHARSNEPRELFAARLGAKLAHPMPASISRGWEVQTDAVSVLTRDASEVSLAEVERVTRDISGVWLMMIAEIGAIPRPLTPGELAAFEVWGEAIQKADALNDLHKDIADGHWATYPLRLLYERSPAAYAAARQGAPIDPLLEEHDVPRACLDVRLVDARAAHANLGEVPHLLDWIHRHLTARWAARRV